MLPSALVTEVREGIADFLRASFSSNTPGFEGLVGGLIEAPGGLTRGPYVALRLPFRRGSVGPEYFPEVPMAWPPHAHQERAFARLSGERRAHTLVATGTGSGKTESFLIPILAECARLAGARGIKAILIYPMNALASDQARRLAGLIARHKALKGRVTAGLFVGQRERSPHVVMGPDHVITDRQVMIDNPPDILLTNYKMLDYLLMRPREQPLWRDNGPETLRFVVVDELHTFDGAQGTDLACLLRRLRSRLGVEEGALCCVGTSATLGSGVGGGGEEAEAGAGGGGGAGARLIAYASQVFGARFEADAVVTESRVDIGEFLQGRFPEHLNYPIGEAEAMAPGAYHDEAAYVRAQAGLWFGDGLEEGPEPLDDRWRVALGEALKGHVFFQQLAGTLGGDGPMALGAVVEALRARLRPLREAPVGSVEALVSSFVALISAARSAVPETAAQRAAREAEGRPRPTLPMVQVQVQLWVRELRRMVASVSARPELRYFDDLTSAQRQAHLPVVYCPRCSLMGWASLVKDDRRHELSCDLQGLYAEYFAGKPRVAFVFPGGVVQGQQWRVDTATLRRERHVRGEAVPEGQAWLTEPGNVRRRQDRDVLSRDCPRCGANEALTLVGFRAATLLSSVINQLYASRFNDDKKLLAFSDSVQNAAHRAGFFEARTWRLNLRVAIQQALQARAAEAGEGAADLALSEVAAAVVACWRGRMASERFVATFAPPELEGSGRLKRLRDDGALRPDEAEVLERLIRRRIDWEVHAEYGLNARIGRTLPKALVSVAYADDARVEAAVEALVPALHNTVGGLRHVTAAQARRFVLGLVQRLLERGAVFQPELPWEYVSSGGSKRYGFKLAYHLPNYGPRSRLPVFATLGRRQAAADPVRLSSRASWFARWFEQTLAAASGGLVADDPEAVYSAAFAALEAAGVMASAASEGGALWGLRGEALRVSLQAAQARCAVCASPLPIAAHQAALWDGCPCLEPACSGVYALDPGDSSPLALYRQMYTRGEVRRVVTAEHTGLLTREARQQLEARFKAPDAMPWEPNVLSCTPTLEMGIDIGELSTALLCEVPPGPANYIQRVGRAGRRDGNALIVTLACGDPRDLYFYAEPEEMIAGEVQPPGVYLSASAVLERQLTAYCVDRWVQDAPPGQATLPDQLRAVFQALEQAQRAGAGPPLADAFPYNLLAYVEAHQTELLAGFLAMFRDDETSPEARAHLTRFVEGGSDGHEGSLGWKIINALTERWHEHRALHRQLPRLTKQLRRLRAVEVKDDHLKAEIQALEVEQEALRHVARAMREVPVLSCLTDEGLLPNYAFPEAGVTLRSVISRRRKGVGLEVGASDGFEQATYEYVRPAASALLELAPNNHFYADGYRVEIDKIDMTINPVEPWRFCDRCDHAAPARESDPPTSTCPVCGSAYWSDVAQQRDMLKLRQVFAWSPDRRARIRDDSDDRTARFYVQQTLVTVADQGDQGGWVIDRPEVPFGFEYLRQVVVREVNFGEVAGAGTALTVGGASLVRPGFRLCGVCGKVQKRAVREGEPAEQHDLVCKARGKADGATLVDCLYLYRELHSEAVRVLLPFLDEGADSARQHAFVCAFQMGLAAFFGGSIDHLRVTATSAPVADQSARKQFLVLYDAIPGGTGYVKELARSPDKVFAILRLALERLKSCACQRDPDKDGCHRCIFAFRPRRSSVAPSRDVAIDLLTQIVRHEGDVVQTARLGDVEMNALFDSVLEARWVESLRRAQVDGGRPSVSRHVVHGKAGYQLKVGDQRWWIEPQVDLGPAQGVEVACRPDFVCWPARADDARRPVAVFADGFAFHKGRVGDDMRKRMALLRSGRFVVWSLTWGDVDDALKGKASAPMVPLLGDVEGLGGMLQRLAAAVKAPRLVEQARAGSHAALMAYLSSPDGLALGQLRARVVVAAALLAQRRPGAQARAWAEALSAEQGEAVGRLLGAFADVGACLEQPHAAWWAAGSKAGAQRLKGEELALVCRLDDRPEARERPGFQAAWSAYLRALNLFQFLPRLAFVTRHHAGGAEVELDAPAEAAQPLAGDAPRPPAAVAAVAAVAAAAAVVEHVAPAEPGDDEAAAWAELAHLSDGYGPVLDALRAAGCPLPTQGYEPLDARGRPEGLAELAWERLQVAVLFEGDDPAPFERRGWAVVWMEALEDDPQALVERIQGRM